MTAALGGNRVLYLYGVVPGGRPLPAISVAPLQAVPFGSLAAISARLRPEGVTLELTGPWLPYSFCDDDASD